MFTPAVAVRASQVHDVSALELVLQRLVSGDAVLFTSASGNPLRELRLQFRVANAGQLVVSAAAGYGLGSRRPLFSFHVMDSTHTNLRNLYEMGLALIDQPCNSIDVTVNASQVFTCATTGTKHSTGLWHIASMQPVFARVSKGIKVSELFPDADDDCDDDEPQPKEKYKTASKLKPGPARYSKADDQDNECNGF